MSHSRSSTVPPIDPRELEIDLPCQETAVKRILIVEDNELNRDVLSRRLARRGYQVSLAADGPDGVSLARAQAPDLILLDLGLPGLDGWECARALKADAATQGIPIIALTAHAMCGEREKALDAGCDDFDTKPIEFDGLLAKVNRLLTTP
jgi:two-component system cell cycle response regulator DivK